MTGVALTPAAPRIAHFIPGLEGVVAAQTRLSRVDGAAGELVIAGYPVEALAGQASFEEVAYLLWQGALPNRQQLAELRANLAAQRALPPITLAVLQAAAQARQPVMDALRSAAGTLGPAEPDLAGLAGMRTTGIGLLARMPVIVAAYWRLL